MASYRTIRSDENALNDRPLTSKLATTKTGLSSRAALGDLVNRPALRTVGSLGLKKSSTTAGNVETDVDAKPAPLIDVKKIKARVDTHWNGAVPLRGLQRTHSLRTTAKSTATTASNGATVAGVPRLTRSRIGTTATVQSVRYITTKPERVKSPEKLAAPALVRRQESNLTRKSLTKLKEKQEAIKQIKQNVAEKLIAIVEPTSHSQKMLCQFEDFNDVDADDEDPLLVAEYVNSIFDYLNELELKYAIRENHLDGQRDVFPKMRAVLIDWINEVHLQYRFAQETFHMAVSLIDRYLQAVTTTSRQNLQLVGVSALFIASKYEELYPPEVKDFVYITDDTYTRDEVLRMEKHILKKLKFELGCPLSIHFLRRFSKVATSPGDSHLMSKYFLELANVEYKMCHYRPSEIAAASLFISLYLSANIATPDVIPQINLNQVWTPTLQYYTKYNSKALQPIIRQLITAIINAPEAKLCNVYSKYSTTKMSHIAIRTAKCTEWLKKLAEINF